MPARTKRDRRSDQELVTACNNGDRNEAIGAFDALYTRHKDYVVRVARRFVGDNESALDVLQETFTYLLRQFPPAGPGLTLTAQLTSLLYKVAKNNAITIARKAGRFPASGTLGPDDLPAEPIADSGATARLIGELDGDRREVLLLRFVDDLPLRDIAAALDIPVGTVKSRLHLGIKQLRESPAAKELLDP